MKHIALASIVIASLWGGAVAAHADMAAGAVRLVSQSGAAISCDGASFIIGAGNALDKLADGGSPDAYTTAAARYLDLRAIGFAALGRYRKLLPPSQQSNYFTLTQSFIGRFMADHSDRFRTAGITVNSCDGPASAMVVRGRLASGGKFAAKLRLSGSGYRITDIQLESLWLVQSLREAFVGTISRDGMDGLFRYLKS